MEKTINQKLEKYWSAYIPSKALGMFLKSNECLDIDTCQLCNKL